MINNNKISACLVVYNEEKIIERCLKSICDFVDEIIIVHDGVCTDQTLEIAKKYTDKIFIKEHIGIAEPHRSFTYEQAKNEWILQIDADEYIDKEDADDINSLTKDINFVGYWFKWELWNGQKVIRADGLKKLCLFRRDSIYYYGLPQEGVHIKRGKVKDVSFFLHHKPLYNNFSWETYFRKIKKWIPIHAKYFFPELVNYETYECNIEDWLKGAEKIKQHIFIYMLFGPLKSFFGQLKNGLWKTWYGLLCAFYQYINSVYLYWNIYKLSRKNKQFN